MQIKDLIKLLETYGVNDEAQIFIKIDGVDYGLEIEGVGTIEDDKVIYIYAKEDIHFLPRWPPILL